MKYLNIIVVLVMVSISSYAQAKVVPMNDNPIWKRSQIVPAPSFVAGANEFYFEASDGWMMINEPGKDIVELLSKEQGWEPMTKFKTFSGVNVPQYKERLFKRKFTFPKSFNNQRVIIRFEGVAHAAKLYVNGQFVRDHWGSFSAWTADITDYIKDGKAIVGVYTDERREGLAAYTNGCAFEPLYNSGIQYGVSCYAVPQNYIVRANHDVFFDSEYKNAKLRIYMRIAENSDTRNNIEVQVKSPDGEMIEISPSTFTVPENTGDFYIETVVTNPIKWDAEHPNLCEMSVSLICDGNKLETVSRKIGFRQVELRGRNLYVNGQEVKFRGIWGGNDAKQLRDLNINHIRKNWPTQGFLDSCDMFGVYVMDEIPATFTRGVIADDPELVDQWFELMADMMERDYAHPSIIMWSHGNESSPGATTLKVHNFIKAEDPQRPDMFSWAQDVPVDEDLPYDIYSFHYPDVMLGPKTLAECQSAVFNSVSQIVKRVPLPVMPVIADEFAHTPIGNAASKDPNIRNFWGESIKLFWDYMYNTDGSLGGDQFGVFTALGTKVNSPEEWLLRKAYSPVSVDDASLTLSDKNSLSFKVQNRFCHTNLNEVKLVWKIGDRSGSVMCPSLAPAQYGKITLPFTEVSSGDEIEMAFIRKDGFQVDEYLFTIDPKPYVMPGFSNKAPKIVEKDNSISLSGEKFEIIIDKRSGQIESGVFDGNLIITGGPGLNITGISETLPEWKCNSVNTSIKDNLAVVELTGNYGKSDAVFTLYIDNVGMIATEYLLSDFKLEPKTKADVPWNRSYYGGYSEVGVKYELTGNIDRLSWDRKALWTVYPENHIGAAKGTAFKKVKEDPNDWSTFTADRGTYMSFRAEEQPFTNNFRGMKEYIRTATAYVAGEQCGLQAFSPMTDAVRMDQAQDDNSKIEMIINNQWNYPELGLGNYMKKPIYLFEEKLEGITRMRFVSE